VRPAILSLEMDGAGFYLLVPLLYGLAFPAALLLSAILSFFRKSRFLSSSLFTGAMISIVGFAFWLGYCALFANFQSLLAQRFAAWRLPDWFSAACLSSPLWMASLYFILSYGAGFYLVFRKRQKQRFAEQLRSLPKQAAATFREGSFTWPPGECFPENDLLTWTSYR
jgi:hypothetical protein